jgi:transcriptional regulator with GAF, ATPase, and Fis domain
MSASKLEDQETGAPSACVPARKELAPATLHVVHPRELRVRFELTARATVLGRQSGQHTLALLHEFISRKHFQVEWDGARAVHTGIDLSSRNGSTVDGIPATSKVALRDGSVLRVGPAILIYESPRPAAQDEDSANAAAAIPGDAAATRRLRGEVVRAADGPTSVLLCGATGTGKEFIARELHRLSGRAGKLVAVNCAALSPQLVESELFGHVRGAFTGAQGEQAGLFREAHGGTLLLDEIGELPLALQPKLLRVLQEKSVRAVGGTREIPIDVRVVAATNRRLASMVARDEFRRDLYARLCTSEIEVPALQRRRADLLAWIDHFYSLWCVARGLTKPPALVLDTDAAEAVSRRVWLDNLRGIERLVHGLADPKRTRASTLADLPAWFWSESQVDAVSDVVAIAPTPRRPTPSREELQALLIEHGGSIRAVARQLDRDRRQIYRWTEAYGLRDE